MIGEAVDTATVLYDALMQWLIVLATVASILAIAAVACGAWGIRAVMERLDGRETAEQAAQAPQGRRDAHSTPRGRRIPSWAHEQPTTYEEAA